MDGLSVGDELFAVRVLELARLLAPEGNRVTFVRACQAHGVRAFLEEFPAVWTRIIDDPPRPGITPSEQYKLERRLREEQRAAWLRAVARRLEEEAIPVVVLPELSGPELLVAPANSRPAMAALGRAGLASPRSSLSPSQEVAWHRFGWGRELTGECPSRLRWKLFPAWIGDDLLTFDELWERRRPLTTTGLPGLSRSDTVVYLALEAFRVGWSSLAYLLELATALEALDDRWERVLSRAGPRAGLVERAVELVVRLLGVPHPGDMTHHYLDYAAAFERWSRMARREIAVHGEVLRPPYWSCDAAEAVCRRLKGVLTPTFEDVRSVDLPLPLVGLYPLVRLVRTASRPLYR